MTDTQTTPPATAVATVSPFKAFEGQLMQRKENFVQVLPSHIPFDKFIRTAMVAIQNNPDILQCDKGSIITACQKAAQDGLVLDGREAALVKFGSDAQYMPMVAGIMKLVRNSGQLSSLTAQIVYAKDEFSYNPAVDEAPNHNPDWFGTRGAAIGVYAVAKLKDGSTVVEIMGKDDIEAIRKRSRSASKGPWVTDWNEMARKTVLRRISKYLPKSTDRDDDARLISAIEAEDDDYDFIDQPTETAPAKPPRSKRAAEILNAETIDITPDGEVIDAAGPVTEPAEGDVL